MDTKLTFDRALADMREKHGVAMRECFKAVMKYADAKHPDSFLFVPLECRTDHQKLVDWLLTEEGEELRKRCSKDTMPHGSFSRTEQSKAYAYSADVFKFDGEPVIELLIFWGCPPGPIIHVHNPEDRFSVLNELANRADKAG